MSFLGKTLCGCLLLFPFFAGAASGGTPVEGSTYFFRQSFSLPAGLSCAAGLDDLARTLFGLKDESRHFALYASLRCANGAATPLMAEVLFEPSTEDERATLETWVQGLEGSAWQGQRLHFQLVNSIFWNTYGLASKSDQSLIASFEKPRVAGSFAEILLAKASVKEAVLSSKPLLLWGVLQDALSTEDYADWQATVLPVARKVEFQIYTYFLTADNNAEKSSLVYQLTRDCAQLACH